LGQRMAGVGLLEEYSRMAVAPAMGFVVAKTMFF
jgi:hypothetical protein